MKQKVACLYRFQPCPQKTEASELFRLASPSEASMPELEFVAPTLNEYVNPGEIFSVAWTSPDIERRD